MQILTSITGRVADICRHFKMDTLNPQIEACQTLISDHETIDVVVLGNFKAGKSSFLNNLAGTTILPVGVLPLTAVITRLRYGESARASVHFLDGTSREVNVTDVENYIIESKNPANLDRVGDIIIETPALKSYAGLQFVDTPGLNSVFAHNTETSRSWLPRVGAALLAVSVDHPFSEQDAALLKELLHSTPKIDILLTKADLLNAEQIDEVKKFIRRQIASITNEHIRVFTFSTRDDAKSYREVLDRELLLPLADSGTFESESILRHKLRILVADSANYLDIGLAAAAKSESDRSQLRDQILSERHNSKTIIEELRLIERDCLGNTREQLDKILARDKQPLQRELLNELRSQLKSWHLNLWQLSRTYECWLQESLKQKVRALSSSEQGTLVVPLQNAERRFSRAVHNFKESLATNVEQTIRIKMPSAEWKGDVRVPRDADVSVSPAFDVHLDSIWFLLPMPLIKKWVHRHFLRKVSWEVEKNLSRLAWQWAEAVNARIRELARQAESYITTETETIENLLARQTSQVPQIEQALDELAQFQSLLRSGVE